jgi:ketosteroid isomerase-like protein
MPQENVEIVRRAWDAWERRDIEGLFALYDPAIIWDMSHYDDVIGGVFRGHEGVRRFFGEWLEPFETYYAHAETFIDAGDNVVVEVRLPAETALGREIFLRLQYATGLNGP